MLSVDNFQFQLSMAHLLVHSCNPQTTLHHVFLLLKMVLRYSIQEEAEYAMFPLSYTNRYSLWEVMECGPGKQTLTISSTQYVMEIILGVGSIEPRPSPVR